MVCRILTYRGMRPHALVGPKAPLVRRPRNKTTVTGELGDPGLQTMVVPAEAGSQRLCEKRV
jgi:hypothetical protein